MRFWKIVLVISLFFILFEVDGHVVKEFSNPKQFDSLLCYYGNNKTFDSTMLLPALLAIQYYPELKNTHIEFKYKNIPTLMAARPKLWSVFNTKKNRTYVLIISTNPENHSNKLFQNMSLSSKTGILGHEFAHFIDYEQKSNFELLIFGIKYIFSKKKIERETDKVAIERGLGIEMLDYTLHIKKSKLTSKKYRARKKKFYLSETEIRNLVSNTI